MARRKKISSRKKSTAENRIRRLDLLLSAALALPASSGALDCQAQTPADRPVLSLGYFNYSDDPLGAEGVEVQTPSIYFKAPLGPRTEIEGGFVYDSVSGASAERFQPHSAAATPVTPAPPVVTPAAPPVCRYVPVQTLTRASGSSGGSSSGSSGSSGGSGSSNPRPPSSSGGGSSNIPICGSGVSVPSAPSTPSVPAQPQPPVNDDSENHDQGEGEHENEHESDRRGSSGRSPAGKVLQSAPEFSDTRYAGDLKITHYFDSFSLGAGAAVSSENDYESVSGLTEARIWTPDKNTTFALGLSANFDDVSSAADSSLSESKDVQSMLAGVTQVLSPISIVQSNVTLTLENGYLTDPYRYGDLRPDSRTELAWLTRYNLYIEPMDAAFHLDYRLYDDTWDIMSHMLEASLYQPIFPGVTLRPSLRYYTQSNAKFYSYQIEPDGVGDFSSDPRLGAYGGITGGLKLIFDLGADFSASVAYDYLTQRSSLCLGSSGSNDKRDSLDAQTIFITLTKKF